MSRVLLPLAMLLLSGCGDYSFSGDQGSGAIPPDEVTGVVIQQVQPALAVRGMSCVTCHGDIRSNVITDFGHGHSFYLGGSGASLVNTISPFTNTAQSWQTLRNLNGQVYIPKALATRSVQDSLGGSHTAAPLMSLKQLLSTPYNSPWIYYPSEPINNQPMTLKIAPANGAPRLIEKSTIVIRGPEESEIRNAAPQDMPFQFANGYYFNDSAQTLNCNNRDIVVRGPLLLRRLSVSANGGCRIYATGTIFIEDEITYVNEQASTNLQLSSANAIVMGHSMPSLRCRMRMGSDVFAYSFANGSACNAQSRGEFLGYGGRTYASRGQQVLDEAALIGNLKDAEDVSPRKSVAFRRVLLNAPMVHSRYLGQVKGVVIAEIGVFALGDFHFEFDPVFLTARVLPLLSTPVLRLE